MSDSRPLPPRFLDAVVTVMRARGRDFDAQPLTEREASELATSFLVGRTPVEAAQSLAGELIRLRPWIPTTPPQEITS